MYNPKIWYDGDIVTSGGLNNMEQGIAQNAHDIETINDSIEDLSADAKATGDAISELKSNLQAMMPEIVFSYNRSATLGDYKCQSICYDTRRGRWAAIGGSTSANGQAKLTILTDLTNLSNPVLEKVVETGHSNSICYDPINDCFHVCAYGTNGDTAEGNTQKNQIISLSPTTGEIISSRILSRHTAAATITYHDGYLYIFTNLECVKYTTSFEFVEKLFDINRTAEIAYIGADGNNTLRNDVTIYNNKFFRCFYVKHNTFEMSCYLLSYAMDGTYDNIYAFDLGTYEEIEGIEVVDGCFYFCTDSYSIFSFLKYDAKRRYMSHTRYRYIPQNSDLNNYVAIGKFFCNNASAAETMINKPSSLAAGFTLEVIQAGSENRRQFIYSSGAYAYTRIYARNTNTWSEWKTFLS